MPPETQTAENKDMYNPILLFIWSGFVIRKTPVKPKMIIKKVFKFIFSLKNNEEKKQVKKTFVNPMVLAWAKDK